MSDFNRSRGCGAPLFTTAAEDSTLRSSTCPSQEDRSRGCSCGCGETHTNGCGCGETRTTVRTSCSCGTGTGNGGSTDPEGCTCCKASMRQALRLLCSNCISDLLDFDGFAFITDDLVVGTQTVPMCPDAKDNLSNLEGTFRRFSPCNCDLIDIEGCAYGPCGALIDVDQATLCSLSAIAFQVQGCGCDGGPGGETTPPPPPPNSCDCLATPAARYRRVRDLLQCELRSCDRDCGECVCHCDCTDDCCCTQGVLAALSALSLNKRATLIAGLLVLRNVTVLGTIGNVLVLGNDCDHRFYFVCANKVEMLA